MFYRIDGVADGDYGNLSSARFIALAERTLCYPGAVRSAWERQEAEQLQQQPTDSSSPPPAAPDIDTQLAASLNMESL